jgi:hypothetical protein
MRQHDVRVGLGPFIKIDRIAEASPPAVPWRTEPARQHVHYERMTRPDRCHGNNLRIELLDALVLTEYADLGHTVIFGDRKQPGRQNAGIYVHRWRLVARSRGAQHRRLLVIRRNASGEVPRQYGRRDSPEASPNEIALSASVLAMTWGPWLALL